jgi:hypothetical protein
MLTFSLASVVVEKLAILQFFTKYKLQNISGTRAATWWQKMAVIYHNFVFIGFQTLLVHDYFTLLSRAG